MQIIGPPPGLDAYPGQSLSKNIGDLGQTIASTILMKKQMDEQKAQRKLELYMKTAELTGELDKPTPDIQEAFKKYYKTAPTGIFETGGPTLAGRKAKAEIAKTEAETTKDTSMADWYKKKQSTNTDSKALDYAVKYANAKLGKPFEVLSDQERGLWQNYYDEGMGNWTNFTSKNSGGKTGDLKGKSNDAIAFMNQWKTLDPNLRKSALTDPNRRPKIDQKLAVLGLTVGDLEDNGQ